MEPMGQRPGTDAASQAVRATQLLGLPSPSLLDQVEVPTVRMKAAARATACLASGKRATAVW